LVIANDRSKCFGSSFSESDDIWCTTASGSAFATASPTAALSNPSTTTACAPSFWSPAVFAGSRVVAVTRCPRSTSWGISRRPTTPVPPAT
jgi:hypothetical protein